MTVIAHFCQPHLLTTTHVCYSLQSASVGFKHVSACNTLDGVLLHTVDYATGCHIMYIYITWTSGHVPVNPSNKLRTNEAALALPSLC